MNFLRLKSFKAKNPKTNKRCYGTLGYRQHSGLGNLKKNDNTILNKIDLMKLKGRDLMKAKVLFLLIILLTFFNYYYLFSVVHFVCIYEWDHSWPQRTLLVPITHKISKKDGSLKIALLISIDLMANGWDGWMTNSV